MKARHCAVIAAVGLFAPAFADDAQTPPPANLPTASQTVETDPMICRVLEPGTGTRLGARRICQRKSVWDQQRRDAGEELEQLQKGATRKNPQS